jgi:transposase
MWAPVGTQPEIPAPGQNEKSVVYGGVDYATSKITYTIADSKSGTNFLVFLVALVKSYAGRRIRLVCDNGRFHHTRAVKEWLEANSDRIEIYWLPPYSPSLNLIERLWGHLKRTVLANVLFESLEDLMAAFRKGVGRVNGHRDRMGFMFDHDDVRPKTG